MKKEKRTAIILPTYNEADNIENIITQLHNYVIPSKHHIYIVDDDSPDGTWNRALELAYKYRNVTVILRTKRNINMVQTVNDPWHAKLIVIQMKKRGLAPAVVDAFQTLVNTVDNFIIMDADGQHPPEAVPKIIQLLDSNEYDLVIGSRYADGAHIEKWSPYRYIISRTFTHLVHLLLPQLRSIKDVNAGFFGVKSDVVKHGLNDYDPDGFKILWEVVVKSRVDATRIKEIPIVFRNRLAGYSKAGIRVGIAGLKNMFKLHNAS